MMEREALRIEQKIQVSVLWSHCINSDIDTSCYIWYFRKRREFYKSCYCNKNVKSLERYIFYICTIKEYITIESEIMQRDVLYVHTCRYVYMIVHVVHLPLC